MFNDTNTSSQIQGYVGVLRLNNNTLDVIRPDTNTGLECFQTLGGQHSKWTNTSKTQLNCSTTPTQTTNARNS